MPKRQTAIPSGIAAHAPTLDELIQGAATLTRLQLKELTSAIAALLEATDNEPAPSVGEKSDSPTEEVKPKKGHIEMKTIRDKATGKTYGPYPYLRYWHEGKLKSRYIKDPKKDASSS